MVTWRPTDVSDPGRRPGVFINVAARAQQLITGGLTGVVAATIKAGWGPTTVQRIETVEEALRVYSGSELPFNSAAGTGVADQYNAYFVIKNILEGGASAVLARRVLGPNPVKSSLTLRDTTAAPISVIRIDARYAGRHGNTFQVQVAATPGASTQQITLRDGDNVVLATWTSESNSGSTDFVSDFVDIINNDDSNVWVDAVELADGNNILATVSSTPLSESTDVFGDEENISNSSYTSTTASPLKDFELENFEILYIDDDNVALRTSIRSWVESQRNNNGNRIQYITGSSLAETVVEAIARNNFNREYVNYVYPGIKAADRSSREVTYPGYLGAARVSGIMAGLPLSESLTFYPIEDINDVETRLSNDDIRTLLAGGIMPIVWDGARFKIERGINSLVTLNDLQDDSFKKIKIIRILDNIYNALNISINDNSIGKTNNNAAGRADTLRSIRTFLQTQSDDDLIEPNYTVGLDPDNPTTVDSMFVLIGVQPIDSIEFVYMTIRAG